MKLKLEAIKETIKFSMIVKRFNPQLELILKFRILEFDLILLLVFA